MAKKQTPMLKAVVRLIITLIILLIAFGLLKIIRVI
jgi:hypothetical protein